MGNLVFCFFTAESEQSELLCLPGAVAQVTGIKGSNIVRVGEVRESLPRTTFEVNTANYQVHQSIKKVGWACEKITEPGRQILCSEMLSVPY